MCNPTRAQLLFILSAALPLLACQNLVEDYLGAKPEGTKTIRITMVGKSSDNPVFLSARLGAEAAAKDLSENHKKLDVRIDWRTPKSEDANAQAERIRAAVSDGTDAILVSCSDDAVLTSAIDDAVAHNIPVMTFDSDAPHSKRFAFYGPDDVEIGVSLMNELAMQLNGKGKIAILAGNGNAPNLMKRVEGVKRAALAFPGIEIIGVFPHRETPEDAAAEVLRVNQANRDLAGWAMVGGWPFFSDALLDKIDPAQMKIVAVDALPVQFPYIERGIVPVFFAQPTFKWGKVAVEKVIDKIYLKKDVPVMNEMKLIRVSKDNLGGWARQLKAWGYEGVPPRFLTYVSE